MMSVKDVAEKLKLSVGAVYKAVNAGELEHHRFGTAIRITEDQLAAWLDRTRTGSSPDSEEEEELSLFSTRQFKHL